MLHTVGYEDGGRTRSILHRASISEMVVPYGDPGPIHGWKNAFDAGEWGLGRMANSLALGCDCLGEIHYLDAVIADEHGNPNTTANAICIHEEDHGILWKHVDLLGGRTEVRRSRRLVISSIATVGNYEYGFYWYFYQDGSLELEVKLTGIMSTGAGAGQRRTRPAVAAGLVAPGPPAPVLRPARHRRRRPGRTRCTRSTSSRMPAGDANPWGNGFAPVATRLEHELQARRRVDPARSRVVEGQQPRGAQRRRRAGRLQADPRRHAHAAGRRGLEHRGAGRVRHPQPVGHAVRARRAPGRRRLPQPARRRRRPARAGPRPTARSSTPTSCCGTRSASPTCPARRTGR